MTETSPRVTVVDYGRGNLRSILRALEHMGASAAVTSAPEDIAAAERLLLPGVGAFPDGMEGLRSRGLIEPLRRFCATGRPFLGICLGMQLLMSEGDEFGPHPGLGLVPGRAVRLPDQNGGTRFKVPHVGWNSIEPSPAAGAAGKVGAWAGTILENLQEAPHLYFVHSYVAAPADTKHALAVTRYGAADFCSVLRAGNIYGVQFHPEKSGPAGLDLLRRWTELPLP